MIYGTIPHLDKKISRLVMGVIPLPTNDQVKSFELLDAYRAAGGNIVDNSYHYGPGFSAIMKAYYEKNGQDAFIRFDKGNHHHYGSERPMRLTKEDMDLEIRANLERQGVEYSDIYMMHRDDEAIPVGDVVQWLNEHKDAGRIKTFGGSNWSHQRIEAANEYAAKNGLQGFSASSPNLSLATVNEAMWTGCVSLDREARDWYEKNQFPILSWSSGGGGFFVGYESDDIKRVYYNETNFARKARLEKMAEEKGVTPSQLALAWSLNQPFPVFGLIGPRTVEQIQDNVGAADIVLTQQELDFLENGN